MSRRIALAKGLDAEDKVLLRAISDRLVRALLIRLRRGTVASPGKVRGARVWRRWRGKSVDGRHRQPHTCRMSPVRLSLLAALALALAGCATALAGPIPRVSDVTSSYRAG